MFILQFIIQFSKCEFFSAILPKKVVETPSIFVFKKRTL